MQDKLVCGVDFSGANKTPNDTWLAYGRLSGWQYEVLGIKHVGSHALAAEISRMGLTALGIDCPFSLPSEFIQFLAASATRKDFQSWQELAEHLVFTSFDDFHERVKEFKREPKRIADKAVKAPALSPLHRGNPSMVQMTYQGIRLLASLDPTKYSVLPFQSERADACAVIEVYPRDFLKLLALPETGYKSKTKKEEQDVEKLRRQILYGMLELKERKKIAHKDTIRLTISKELEHQAISSDHALDAVIASYITALFVTQRPTFSDPFNQDDDKVLLEGWIYSMQE